MTTELTKAAQQALGQLEFLNACYPHKTAADAIASLQSALTLRPAAQTEREAFEAWARPNGYDLRRNDVLDHYSSMIRGRCPKCGGQTQSLDAAQATHSPTKDQPTAEKGNHD